MSYGEYLKELLRPLGVYQLEGTLNGAELESLGAALDQVEALLEHIHTEADLTQAEGEGLDAVERLLVRRPVTDDLEQRRKALAALLRVSGDSFTRAAINDNLAGCGLNAVAWEVDEAQVVKVTFPDVAGIPEGFEEMRKIIEDILPCHLDIEYLFWYITWGELEQRFATWGEVEALGATWEELEKMVK